MQHLLNVYFSAQIFIVSMIGTYFFARKVPKRKHFYLTFVIGTIIGACLSTILWSLSKKYGGDYRQLYIVLTSFFILIELFVFFRSLYEIKLIECVTYVMAGWTMLHLSGKIQYFICLFTNVKVDFFNYSWQYVLINFCCLTLILVSTALALHFLNKSDTRVRNPKVILPLALIVVVSVIFNAYTPYDISKNAEIFLNIYALAFCIISLYFIFWSFDNSNLSTQLEFVKELDKKKAKQYQMTKESISIINNRTHDLKKIIKKFGISNSILTDEEISFLNKQISFYDNRSKTGIMPLDTIVTEKILIFEKNQIKFSYFIDTDGLEIFSDFELYTLFGNILDNAEEALLKCDVKNRYDELRVSKSGNLLVIHNENYTNSNIVIDKNHLFTSKKDKMNHGYGTNSIKETVKKFNGVCTFSCADNVFSVDILIPLKNKK